MIARMFGVTLVAGIMGLGIGMFDSAFRHYYYKFADGEDRKTLFIQDVEAVQSFSGSVEE